MSGGMTDQGLSLMFKKCFINKLHGFVMMTVSSLLLVGISQAELLGPKFSGFEHILDSQMQMGILDSELTQPRITISGGIGIWRTTNREAGDSDVSGFNGLRDPFAPLKKPIPVSKTPTIPRNHKPSQVLTPLPGKLLSVVNGPWGYLAIIQISSSEHLMVGTGELVADTGWRVKEIQEDRVRLEFVNSASHPSGGSAQIPSTMLFFE